MKEGKKYDKVARWPQGGKMKRARRIYLNDDGIKLEIIIKRIEKVNNNVDEINKKFEDIVDEVYQIFAKYYHVFAIKVSN